MKEVKRAEIFVNYALYLCSQSYLVIHSDVWSTPGFDQRSLHSAGIHAGVTTDLQEKNIVLVRLYFAMINYTD